MQKTSGSKAVFIDCSAGAAGDMLLAAALHALSQELPQESGEEPLREWQARIAGLLACEAGGRVELRTDMRGGLRGMKVDFYVGETHSNLHHHRHGASHAAGHGRHLKDILRLIEETQRAGSLQAEAAELAERIFRILAEAEARVHGTTIDKVHFHEVGAFDSIMDVAGFAAAWTALGAEYAAAAPVATGSGTVETSHGRLGVPAPAVVEVLRDFSIPTAGGLELGHEALTPTGAACLAAVIDAWDGMPAFRRIDCHGVGLGTREVPGIPNAVRMVVGLLV